MNLRTVATLASWATPNCMDSLPIESAEKLARAKSVAGCSNIKDQVPVIGILPDGSIVETAKGGQLTPAHSRWLMGYPAVWGFCGATAMQSCRKSPRRSSKRI
jgi:hypothetical protein